MYCARSGWPPKLLCQVFWCRAWRRSWVNESTLAAERQAARFAEGGGRGVTLRYGLFYAPYAPSTIDSVRLARRGLFPVLGSGAQFVSSIHVDDAAAAAVAALDVGSGVYNVVDDEPLSRAGNIAALAGALGVPTPVPPSATPDLPPHLSAMLRSQRVSNARFKAATGWRPRFPSAGEGWAHVVAEWSARMTAVRAPRDHRHRSHRTAGAPRRLGSAREASRRANRRSGA